MAWSWPKSGRHVRLAIVAPAAASPALRWRGGRSFGLLAISLAFVGVALYLPDRFTAIASPHPLEIGKLVGELRAEVETLKQEKILEPKKADDLQKQLAGLKEKSSALDPNKTWEALDHLKEANSDLARQAAEEALNKTTSLAEAQTSPARCRPLRNPASAATRRPAPRRTLPPCSKRPNSKTDW